MFLFFLFCFVFHTVWAYLAAITRVATGGNLKQGWGGTLCSTRSLSPQLALCAREPRLTFITWGADRLGPGRRRAEGRGSCLEEIGGVVMEGGRGEWSPFVSVCLWVGIKRARKSLHLSPTRFLPPPRVDREDQWRRSTIIPAAPLGRNWLVKLKKKKKAFFSM